MKNIYLVRHCQAEGQAANAQLTEAGKRQALRLASFLQPKNIEYIVSSPYERAYGSISPLAEQCGIDIAVDERLKERVLSGQNHSDWRDKLRMTFDDLQLCFDGGESSHQAMSRAIPVLEEVLSGSYANAVIVTHGNLLALMLKYYDDRIGYDDWEKLTNPDVYRLSFTGDSCSSIERIWTD